MSEEVGKFSRGSLSSTTIQDLMMFRCIQGVQEEPGLG